MKKSFLIIYVFSALILFAVACNKTSNPATPSSSTGSNLISVKDIGTSVPVTIITTQVISQTTSDGMTGACGNVKLDCSGNDTITQVLAIPTQGTFQDGAIAIEDPEFSILINGNSLVAITDGAACGYAVFVKGFNESANLSQFKSLFSPFGSSTVVLEFEGCYAYSFTYSYSLPVTLIVTATPTNTPIVPTNTPTPTATPTPNCPGNGYHVPLTVYYQGTLPGGGKEPWSQTDLDDSDTTISKGGCFLTCFSMLSQTNPSTLNSDLTAFGAIDDDGNLNEYKAAEYLAFNGVSGAGGSSENITSALEQGQYVIAEVSVGNSSHFVVVTGSVFDPALGQCRYTIQDPAGSIAHTFLDQYGGAQDIRIFGSNGNTTPGNN